MRRFPSKSNSFRNPTFTSLFSHNSSEIRLCDSTTSAISEHAKFPNGYSQIRHLGRNSSFFGSQIRFGRAFSSGQWRNFAGLRDFGGRTLWSPSRRSFSGEPKRESIEYDVVIVGAGPAGLSAAIRLKQLCREKGVDLSVCVVEKGAEVGAHILSGNVFEPRALNELLPQWKHEELVRWMGDKAEELGVEIYPGFAASEILYDANGVVVGIGTNDMGIAKDGSKKENFQRGVALKGNFSLPKICHNNDAYAFMLALCACHETMCLTGRITLLSEGCRGSLSEGWVKLTNDAENLKFKGLIYLSIHSKSSKAIKARNYEFRIVSNITLFVVWEIDKGNHKPGAVLHTLGWPLDQKTYGGSFLYHMKDRQVSIGLVVALNYHNPFLNPYEEFQAATAGYAVYACKKPGSNDYNLLELQEKTDDEINGCYQRGRRLGIHRDNNHIRAEIPVKVSPPLNLNIGGTEFNFCTD
ncbi:hypothetical protein TIFTF001_034561 [Ficus carica]|uniref:Electron transfer flavoprotein-ubiquinone oxidoreductase n=1 Tax=Ficus carica TaxID=3494 RepID=A0AA88E864_FICCA|nr:hypothetical protein TIFTF001_034561 [Ficus carica]